VDRSSSYICWQYAGGAGSWSDCGLHDSQVEKALRPEIGHPKYSVKHRSRILAREDDEGPIRCWVAVLEWANLTEGPLFDELSANSCLKLSLPHISIPLLCSQARTSRPLPSRVDLMGQDTYLSLNVALKLRLICYPLLSAPVILAIQDLQVAFRTAPAQLRLQMTAIAVMDLPVAAWHQKNVGRAPRQRQV
jgi:hypothetical protein